MAQRDEYRRTADEAFVVLRDRLRPFVEERFRQTYPDSWERKVGLDRLRATPLGRGTNRGPSDPDHLLGLVISYWVEIFKPVLDGDDSYANQIRSLAFELRALRGDDYHHVEGFAARDAWRTVDSTRRLLDALGLLDEDSTQALNDLDRKVQPGAADERREHDESRRRYLDSIAAQYEFINLGGISPIVDSQVVRLSLDDAYVPATFDAGPPSRTVRAAGEGERGASQEEIEDRLREIRGVATPSTEATVLEMRRVVVVGGAGSGKSTLVHRAARRLALESRDQDSARTPIVVVGSAAADAMASARSWSLTTYIRDRLSIDFGSVLARDIRDGRAAVFVDGLDEITDAGARARFAQSVDTFSAEHPQIRVLVTTRPVGYRDAPMGPAFGVYRIRALDDSQIEQFLTALERCTDEAADPATRKEAVDRLLDEIEGTAGVRELAGTPLLLTIIALLWRRGGHLPERRVELLEAATQTLLRQWPLQHGFGLDEYDLRGILEPVAARVVTGGEQAILHRSELRRLLSEVIVTVRGETIDEARHSAEVLLRVVEEQTGFFVEQGLDAGEPVYGFIHRSFAEYLAARHLFEERAAGRRQIADFAFDGRWGDAVRLFFAHAARAGVELASQLLSELMDLEPPYERHLHRRILLALNVLGDHVRVRPTVSARVVAAAVDLYLTTPYDPLAAELLELLVEVGPVVAASSSPGRFVDQADPMLGPPMRRALLAWRLRGADDPLTLRALLDAITEALRDGVPGAEAYLEDAVDRLEESAAAAVNDVDGEKGEPRQEPGFFVLRPPGDEGEHASLITPVFSPSVANSLVIAGLLECSAGDLAHQRDLPPGFGAAPWVLDASDCGLVEVEDVVALGMRPATRDAAKIIAFGREWTDDELASVARSAAESDLDDEATSERLTMLRAIVFGALRRQLGTTPEEPPSWLQELLSGPSMAWRNAFPRWLAGGITRGLPQAGLSWVSRTLEEMLVSGSSDEVLLVCRAIQSGYALWRADSETREAFETVVDEGVRVALEVTADDHDDFDIRAEARRAWVLVADPEDVFRLFGEDGIARQPASTIDAPAYAAIVNWLVWTAAGRRDPEDANVVATQLRRILAWTTKPALNVEDPAFFVAMLLTEGELDLPAEFLKAAWSSVGCEEAESRQWAAAAWSAGHRSQPAANELAILMGDAEATVRAIGAAAVQPVDIGDGSWLGDAIDRILRESDPVPMNALFDTESLYDEPRALDSIRQRAAKILDEGTVSLEAYSALEYLVDQRIAPDLAVVDT